MSDKSRFHRRSLRLDAFDYAEERAYFVTVCACERGEMFGRVVGDTVQLNAAGEIARNCWLAIPAHFPSVEFDVYAIMPDHMHGIIVIQPNDDVGARHALPSNNNPSIDAGTRHALSLQNQSRPVAECGKPQPRTLGTIVGSYKSAVTKRVNDLRGTPAAP
ncbi:MAG TPA: hypothetical protein VER79_13735, partial [Candidatus Limnocylindrales bacterium]|nr:hypothetical protein [Candidatus Limnocylindrales bacterium]